MPARHRLLALTVAAAWGLNFLAIDASLEQFPPFFLVALRFALIAVPTLLFVPRPAVEARWLLGYGLGFGILQFLFLYWAMKIGVQPGLASLVLQSSAPFTVLIGAVVFRERVTARRLAGLLVAVGGLALVGWERAHTAALIPFLLVLAGGFGWAIGNVCNARAQAPRPFHLMLWMSTVPPLPMLALSLATEGPRRIGTAFTTTTHLWLALAGLAYTVLIGTLYGSGVWSWLMARYPAGHVAPFSLLVPVVGLSTSAAVLGERLGVFEIVGAALVVGGVLFGSATRLRRRAGRPEHAAAEHVPAAALVGVRAGAPAPGQPGVLRDRAVGTPTPAPRPGG